MKSAIINIVRGLGALLNAYYNAPDRETVELVSACVRWLERHDSKDGLSSDFHHR